MKNLWQELKSLKGNTYFWILSFLFFLILFLFFIAPATVGNVSYRKGMKIEKELIANVIKELPMLDKEDYDRRMLTLANNPPVIPPPVKKDENGNIISPSETPPKVNLWPPQKAYPNAGAILPFNRVIAYYGNLYSKKMGVLGEYEEDIMLGKLNTEVAKWNKADPKTPAIPALHYIVTVAQGSAGADGKYRSRMPDSEIQKVFKMANKINAIVFLDIQVALSDLKTELPILKKYLELPNVHLGIDPEFSMKTMAKPGTVVGTMDGELDVNFAINYLSEIVKDKNIPPKILVVHRYTKKMLTNYAKITPTSEVQVVIHMDGWGGKDKKKGTYRNFIYPEPVQFAGFKLFYKNDTKEPNTTILTPEELLKLNPRPIYIQYQ